MLQILHITTSVQSHWATEFALAPTIYPGTSLDALRLPAWVELWVDAWSAARRRQFAPDRLQVSITVHCFSRESTDKGAVYRLAHAATAALAARTLAIRNPGDPFAPPIGHLSIHDPDVHDLTRNHAPSTRADLQHLVLGFPAVAQELPV